MGSPFRIFNEPARVAKTFLRREARRTCRPETGGSGLYKGSIAHGSPLIRQFLMPQATIIDMWVAFSVAISLLLRAYGGPISRGDRDCEELSIVCPRS